MADKSSPKVDAMRAVREARYAESQAKAKKSVPATTKSTTKAKKPARTENP